MMAAWKVKYGYDGYLFPFDPLVFDKLCAGHGAGPYYRHAIHHVRASDHTMSMR